MSPQKAASNQKGRLVATPSNFISTGGDPKLAASPTCSKRVPSHGGPDPKTVQSSTRRLPANGSPELRSSAQPTSSRRTHSPTCKSPRTPRSGFGRAEPALLSTADPGTLEHWDLCHSEAEDLEKKQKEMQSNQMTLLSSQVHILMQVMGELQKEFVALGQDVNHKIDEIRSDFGASQDDVQEMKLTWGEAQGALSRTITEGLANLAAEQTQALEDHALSHVAKLTEIKELQETRHNKQEKNIQRGIEVIHSTMQEELAALRSGHEVNLMQVVEDVTSQVVQLKAPMEQMAKDVAAAQEADSALHAELSRHSEDAKEMKAGWAEAQQALSRALDDGLSNLAAEHAKALEEHSSSLAIMVEEQRASSQDAKLAEMEELHKERYAQHEAALEQGLKNVHGMQEELAALRSGHEDSLKNVHGTMQEELAAIRSGHGDSLKNVHSTMQEQLAAIRSGHEDSLTQVVNDITGQVNKLTMCMEQMARDMMAAQESDSALHSELAKHSNDAKEMKSGLMEAQLALSKAMDVGLSTLAAEHARTSQEHACSLKEHASSLAKLLDEQQALSQGAKLTEMEELHNERYAQHEAALQQGLKDVQSAWQQELAELRSGHDAMLRQAVGDSMSSPINKLTMSMDQIAKDVATEEVRNTRMRLELAEQVNAAAEMRASWEQAHNRLTKAMDDGFSKLADEHAKALEAHASANAQVLEEHALKNTASLTEMAELHNKRHTQLEASFQQGQEVDLKQVEENMADPKQESAEFRSGQEGDLKQVEEKMSDPEIQLTCAARALCLELVQDGTIQDLQAAREEACNTLSVMDDGPDKLLLEDGDALGEHDSAHCAGLAELEELGEDHSPVMEKRAALDGLDETLNNDI